MLGLVIVKIVGRELAHHLELSGGEMAEVILMSKAHMPTRSHQLACPTLSQEDTHSRCLTKRFQISAKLAKWLGATAPKRKHPKT